MRKPRILALCLLLTSCSVGDQAANDPKKRLTEYISKSFAVKSVDERKELAGYLTGNAKNRINAWSDEQFRQAFVESKRQFLKLSFKEVKTLSPKEINITYELMYLDQGKAHQAKITNKKLAQMVLDQGKWVITEVKNIKELVEYKNEMSLP